MTEGEITLARIECVFVLGGGELGDDPWAGFAYWYEGPHHWAPDADYPTDVKCEACNGAGEVDEPSGADDDADPGPFECRTCEGLGNVSVEYRTVIVDEMYGRADTPTGWERVDAYHSSGESECWWDGPGTDDEHVEAREARQQRAKQRQRQQYEGTVPTPAEAAQAEEDEESCCKLCDDDGFVYIGDGWFEVVYRRAA